jgi:soluble lytic murein transglycosylase
MRRVRIALVLALALATPASGRATVPSEAEGAAMAAVLERAAAGAWTEAEGLAAGMGNRIAADLVLWLRLREGNGDWAEYADFLARNRDWPAIATLRARAETLMPADLAPLAVVRFFNGEAPRTGTGALRLADALTALGRDEAAATVAIEAWRTLSLNRAEEEALLAAHGALLEAEHVERLDMLLWRGLTAEAERMLPLVDADWQALARARIGVRLDVDGTTALIRAVPEALAEHPGLVYERYLYRVKAGRWDEAEEYLLRYSTSAETLGRPDLWVERRANLARQALRRGDVETAYALAADNFAEERTGADFADAEWVAGFIALTRMDDPARAITHFERFRDAVVTPISLGRAGYWLGLAHEAAGDGISAAAAWRAAAHHQTSFYGQLAAERVGFAPDRRLAGGRATPDWRDAGALRLAPVQAALLLHKAGDEAAMTTFLRHVARDLSPAGRAALAQMMADLDRPHLGLRVAKDAARDGIILPGQYYPLHPMAEADWPVPTEFALAIARQESEFNPEAVSPAGARGLMQLMPATAEEVAGKLGEPYRLAALTGEPEYNARLGTAYLARMLAAYDGSYVLAAAAYNAGPGRVRSWLDTFGDPRKPEVDPVIWIETIPFEETRNYVMRVLESLHVYRARLAGEVAPLRLSEDIRLGG